MNTDIFRYKIYFISTLLIISYAYMHMQLDDIYVNSSLDLLIHFKASLPYGQRLLVPGIARGLCYLFSLNTEEAFFLLEIIFVTLFFLANYYLLSTSFPPRVACLLNWLFILLLPLVSIVNYRLTLNGETNFFYPSDSASLFFIAAGFYFCLQKNWKLFLIIVFLGTLNRESTILLVFLVPALHRHHLKKISLPFISAAFAYVIARLIVIWLTHQLPGTLVEWHFRFSQYPLFLYNMTWLAINHYLLLAVYCLAGLPLFCFTFYDYMPEQYRLIRYLVFVYFLGLLLVGIFMESRIFHEIIMLLYLPICLSVYNWLTNKPPSSIKNDFKADIERYGIIIMLILLIIFQQPITSVLMHVLPKPLSVNHKEL